MLQVKAGEIDQLGLLFERYHQVLFHFFYHLHEDATASQDLVQNVFVRILQYRHSFRGEGEFKTWMFHIARNVGNDYLRQRGRRRTDTVEAWQDQIRDRQPDRSQSMIEAEEKQQLRKALGRLTPEQREIIIMSKLQGMKYRDIGEVLNCPEGTVKVKVFRALKALKKQFDHLENQ